MAMQRDTFETMEGQSLPLVRQLTVLLDNRPGELLRLTQVFDSQALHILALNQHCAGDCAIVRLLCDRTDEALELLSKAGFPVCVTEVIVVRQPAARPASISIWSVLLQAEVNVAFTYPLVAPDGAACLVVSVDCPEIAVDTLVRRQFQVLGEADLAR